MHQDEAQDAHATFADHGSDFPTLEVGATVYVRDKFLGDWTTGFKVVEILRDGYRIQRLSDGQSFPDVFAFEDVRLERRQQPQRDTDGSHLDRRH